MSYHGFPFRESPSNNVDRMLAVMTFNVGFLLVIILGVVVGELLFGRFVGGAMWEEGSCHEG